MKTLSLEELKNKLVVSQGIKKEEITEEKAEFIIDETTKNDTL